MVNICMLSCNRYKLLTQALESLYRNTDESEFTLCIADDDSSDFRTSRVLHQYADDHSNLSLIELTNSNHVLAQMKNIAIGYSRLRFGAGQYLLICDNDCCVLPGGLSRMTDILRVCPDIILGGARHPFHQINRANELWDETDAVAGTSQMMRWETWNRFRPLRGNAAGTLQSEDWNLCQRAAVNGYMCGYIREPAILDCGITQTDGSPSIGADVKPRVAGVYYE